jgi:hypothetical protein
VTKPLRATNQPEAFEYQWHSTPALWSAVRPGYDGAPDAHCKIGYGKTPMEAEADLIAQEDGWCACGKELVSEAEQRNAVCRECL